MGCYRKIEALYDRRRKNGTLFCLIVDEAQTKAGWDTPLVDYPEQHRHHFFSFSAYPKIHPLTWVYTRSVGATLSDRRSVCVFVTMRTQSVANERIKHTTGIPGISFKALSHTKISDLK